MQKVNAELREANEDLINAFKLAIREIRKSKRMTQGNVANNCLVEFRYYQELESQSHNPTLGIFFQVAKGLQVHPNVLIDKIISHLKNPDELICLK
jgi:transcriptional regulator with XRE-family HTH domain